MPLLTVAEIVQVQEVIDQVLAAANAHLRAPPTPSHFIELSTHIGDVSSILEAYQALEDQLPHDTYRRSFRQLEAVLETLTRREVEGPPPIRSLRPVVERTAAGRNKLVISHQQRHQLLEEGYTTEQLAEALEVGVSTIERRKKEFNMIDRVDRLTDAEAEELVRAVVSEGNTNIGNVRMQSELLHRGWTIPREQLRRVMGRIDRVGQVKRWVNAVQRRTYFVPFVNSLWHIDGEFPSLILKIELPRARTHSIPRCRSSQTHQVGLCYSWRNRWENSLRRFHAMLDK